MKKTGFLSNQNVLRAARVVVDGLSLGEDPGAFVQAQQVLKEAGCLLSRIELAEALEAKGKRRK